MRGVQAAVAAFPRSLFAIALLAGCASHKGVLAFKVDPPLSCPNNPVTVSWNVDGPAVLEAAPAPPGWDEQIPPQGTRTQNLAASTTFTVIATSGNPAKGGLFASQAVSVSPPSRTLGGSAACDETSRSCSTSFTVLAVGDLKTAHLKNPLFVRTGVEQKRKLCVTPPGATAATCLDPDGSVDLAVPLNGTWRLEATLEPNEAVKPPPQLRVVFDFGCP